MSTSHAAITATRSTSMLVMLLSTACAGGRPEGLGPPTPVGVVGEPYDLRADLPANAEPLAQLAPEKAFGQVLQLGSRGHNTKLRVLTWTTCMKDDLNLCLETRIAAVGVEVMENPESTTVTWTSGKRTGEGVPLDMLVAWPTSDGGLGELSLQGRVLEGGGGLWEPNPR